MEPTYFDYNTPNTSFLEISNYLKERGIENHNFMLILHNKELIGVDPFDINLTDNQKDLIKEEIKNNYWYFLRECIKGNIRIPFFEGYYKINRGLLAFHYCAENMCDIILSQPRQQGISLATLIRKVYQMFVTEDYSITEIVKDDRISEFTRERINMLIKLLPDYIFDKDIAITVTPFKFVRDDIDELYKDSVSDVLIQDAQLVPGLYNLFDVTNYRIFHKDKIRKTFLSYDSRKRCNIFMTTVGGDITTITGAYLNRLRQLFERFDEDMYEWGLDAGSEIYIEFKYTDLNLGEEWYNNQCKILNAWDSENNCPDKTNKLVRRELDLEWF